MCTITTVLLVFPPYHHNYNCDAYLYYVVLCTHSIPFKLMVLSRVPTRVMYQKPSDFHTHGGYLSIVQ